ncbi:MAG: branched-chain amino acid ABC transporter permease [Leptolinea sp.]
MKIKSLLSGRNIALFVIVMIAGVVPVFLKDQYVMGLLTSILIYAALASAWNIIGGMAGQLDLAVAAYVGLGAYTMGTLLVRWNITPWIGMIIGGLVAMGFAVLIGFPLFGFKITGLWYTLTSSALVMVLQKVFLMWDAVGGATERYLPVDPKNPIYSMKYVQDPYLLLYYIILAILVIVIFVNYRIRASKLGYSLLALGEDEDAVQVLGVNSQFAKIKALMIYAFIAGVIGTIYAMNFGYVHPSYFNPDMSTEVAILGIVGGMGITFGPVVAAIFLVSLKEFLRAYLGGSLPGLYMVAYAVILILVVLFQPRGIIVMFQTYYHRIISKFGVKKDG